MFIDPSTFGARGPNQNTSRIQHKEVLNHFHLFCRNKLFRKFDPQKTNEVKLDDITFFIRKVMMAVQEAVKKTNKSQNSAENMVRPISPYI